jgi:GTP pyrophosphokinase
MGDVKRDLFEFAGGLMPLTKRFEDALVYASRLHGGHMRKGTNIPYFSHLIGVASIALEYGAGEDEAIAALLHDAVEDRGGAETREEIRRRFGETVVGIVDACTDADVSPKPPWKQRKDAYLAGLKEAGPSVRLVSAADKLHNIRAIIRDYRSLGDSLWSRFKGDKEGTLWYYRSLANEFRKAGPTPIVDELCRSVSELQRLVDKRGNQPPPP